MHMRAFGQIQTLGYIVVGRVDDGRVQVQPQRPAHQTSNASQTGRSGNLADLYRDQRLPSCQIVAVSPCGRRWQQFAGVAPPKNQNQHSQRNERDNTLAEEKSSGGS